MAKPAAEHPASCNSSVSPLARYPMLYYAVVFFVIALVAALLGFGGIAAGAASIAKVLFIVFLVAAVLTLIAGRTRG